MRLTIVLGLMLVTATMYAADPQTAVFWSAKDLQQRQEKARGEVDKNLHRGVERLLDSATLIYRDGPSEAEAHTDRADFISIREGQGSIVIGGKMIGGKPTTPGEIRGASIEGGTKYAVAAGDALYVPVNVPHQFFVDPGQHFVVTIVKVSPRP